MMHKIAEFTGCIVDPDNVVRVNMFDLDDIWGALCGEGSLKFDLYYRHEELLDSLEWGNRPSDESIIKLLCEAVDSYPHAIGMKEVVTKNEIYHPCGDTSVMESQHKCLSKLSRELCDNANNAKDLLKNWRSVEIEGESSEGPIVLYFKICSCASVCPFCPKLEGLNK